MRDLTDECLQIDDNTGSDDAFHIRSEDTARDQGEFKGLALSDDRVPSVGAALITNDDVLVFGEQVNNLAFRFVSPLKPDNSGGAHGIHLFLVKTHDSDSAAYKRGGSG